MAERDPEEVVRHLGLTEDDLNAWRASGLPRQRFDDWVVDRVARRPSGERAREVYGAESAHDFARRAILEELALGETDLLLEIGWGGGEMVALARKNAPGARVVHAGARHLPFSNGSFTAVAMSVVFFFLDDPVGVLRECARVLRPGGRIAIFTTGPELKGTPAAPEPVASLGHFYSDAELAELARSAGFDKVDVSNDDGGQLLVASLP